MSNYRTLARLELSYDKDTPRIRTREGVELYYESRGEGPAVVMLNNFFLTSPSWRVFTDELARHHRVVSYDMCNHGESSHVGQEPTWEEHGVDLIGLLDGLGIESAYLIGSSSSTVLARDVSLRYPDRVKGLVLAGTVLGPKGMRRHRQLQRAWLRTLENQGMVALYEHIYPEVFSAEMNQELGTPGFLALREAFSAIATVEDLSNGLKLALQGDTSPQLLTQITAPTLVIIGDDDMLLSPTGGRELAALFPNGRCEVMPKAGHLPFLDDAEGFQAIIAKFIEEVESRA